ncbi:hypothetical protein LTR85_012105 [Meristemomyces frigidus]|nr:hypothetical protein LTR85_012105 [Meristemomyces frigidus]
MPSKTRRKQRRTVAAEVAPSTAAKPGRTKRPRNVLNAKVGSRERQDREGLAALSTQCGREKTAISAPPEEVTSGKQRPNDVPISGFRHPPLEDAATQLRLLTFVPDAIGDSLQLTMSICAMSEAPAYVAIFYTWGSADSRATISIDGCPLGVTQNCWHALHQVRRREPATTPIWIDAVCITQSDMAEKSLQVQAMDQIFADASRVWADMGPDQIIDDEAFLCRKLQQLREHREDKGQSMERVTFSGSETESQPNLFRTGSLCWSLISPSGLGAAAEWRLGLTSGYNTCFQQLPLPHWRRLCLAITALGSLHYWQRIWIVQEVVSARRLTLLYNGHEIDDQLLGLLYSELEESFETWVNIVIARERQKDEEHDRCGYLSPNDIDVIKEHETYISKVRTLAMIHTLESKYHGTPRQVIAVLRAYSTAGCSDPRDRVFAMKRAIYWPEAWHPIKTDYSISLVDLALMLIEHCGTRDSPYFADGIATIRQVLGLHTHSPDMIALRKECLERYAILSREYDDARENSSISLEHRQPSYSISLDDRKALLCGEPMEQYIREAIKSAASTMPEITILEDWVVSDSIQQR